MPWWSYNGGGKLGCPSQPYNKHTNKQTLKWRWSVGVISLSLISSSYYFLSLTTLKLRRRYNRVKSIILHPTSAEHHMIFTNKYEYTTNRESTHNCPPPPLRTRGHVILWGSRDGSVGRALDCEPMCCRFESSRGWTFRFSHQFSATG